MVTQTTPADLKIFLTGASGVGKTTVVRSMCDRLRSKGVRMWGFITEGVADDKSRTGFRAITLDGSQVPFAHVLMKRGPRVGPYRVDVTAFEGVVLPSLQAPVARKGSRTPRSVGVIDELGRMECLSRSFCERVRQLLDEPGCLLISLAPSGHALIDEVRRRAGEDLIEVTPANREMLPEILTETFWACLMK